MPLSDAHLGGLFYLRPPQCKKMEFNKKPTTYDEQISLLKTRGLLIPDQERAIRYLKQISYYRLSAYFLTYQQIKDQFNKGVEFNQILDTYRFDRELRLLVFDCMERIEIAIRSQMNHILAQNHMSSHWQDNPDVFKPINPRRHFQVDSFGEFQKIIRDNCNARKPEVFIKHYMQKYDIPQNPPSWMCIELLTIGSLSRVYTGLNQNKDKQDIADFFSLSQTTFTSWLHTLTYARNICAHHSRLWNKEFAIEPEMLKKPRNVWVSNSFNNNKRTFYFLCIIKYLLIGANPNNHLTLKLENLFLKYPKVPIRYIGIPTDKEGILLNWKEEALWR